LCILILQIKGLI